MKQEKTDRGLETRRREKQINDKGGVSEKKIGQRAKSFNQEGVRVCD